MNPSTRRAGRASDGRLRVLAVTNLFPSNVDPSFAPFNRQQFASLGALVDLEVFAVVPWRFGSYYGSGPVTEVVRQEQIDGLEVLHPRYPSIRGMPGLNAGLMGAALVPEILWRLRRGRYQVLLAAYAYPDGCAGVLLSGLFRIPVVVKCHGSDLNRVPNAPSARYQLSHLLPRAEAVVAVSQRLADQAAKLGVDREKIHVVYNGIDRTRFGLVSKVEARARLKLPLHSELVVFVGHLAEHKGARDLLDAIDRLKSLRPSATVAFVGEGPLSSAVQDAAERGIGAPGSVLAVGRVAHAEVPDWICAGDVLCLPSWDEGLPNVVREAHACGRPVVATEVGGVPEAIFRPELGRLVPAHDPPALADALAAVLATPQAPAEAIARLAAIPSWEESAAALERVLRIAAGQ